MTEDSFSVTERNVLRAHGIVLFANRVIFEAQPPMTDGQIAEVQAACAGPIPAALVALWQQTAGGSLDDDLTLSTNCTEEAISWNELFFHGSPGYRDLQGWIAHEQECAEEAAEESGKPWSGRLTHLKKTRWHRRATIFQGIR